MLEGSTVIQQWFSNLKMPKNHVEGLFSFKFPCSDPHPVISRSGWEPLN